MDPNNTPSESVGTEDSIRSNAMSLFSEPNPVIEDALATGVDESSSSLSTPTIDTDQILAQQAAEAQKSNDEPTKVDVATVVPPQPKVDVQPQSAAQTPVVSVLPVQVEPVTAVTPPVTPAQAQPSRPPATQEEIQRELNVYKMTEKDYAAIFDVETREESIQALDGVLQNVVRQSLTMANVLMEEKFAAMQQQVLPYMQFADDQRSSAMETAFYSRHQDLVASKPVVDAVKKQFTDQGVKFDTAEQAFDAIAKNTKAYLQQLVQLGQTASLPMAGQSATPAAQKPRMAQMPAGGQGGATGGASASGKLNTAARLFG